MITVCHMAEHSMETQLHSTAHLVWCSTVSPGDNKIYTSKGSVCAFVWEAAGKKSSLSQWNQQRSLPQKKEKENSLCAHVLIFKALNVHLLVAKRSKVATQENYLVPVTVAPKGRHKIWSKQSKIQLWADDLGSSSQKHCFIVALKETTICKKWNCYWDKHNHHSSVAWMHSDVIGRHRLDLHVLGPETHC